MIFAPTQRRTRVSRRTQAGSGPSPPPREQRPEKVCSTAIRRQMSLRANMLRSNVNGSVLGRAS